MIGVYFSGTGNTRHCTKKFVQAIDANAVCIGMEEEAAAQAIETSEVIVLAYPIYFSNLPKLVRDFLEVNGNKFAGKKVFIITTMGLFSGDGAGCAARLLKRYGAHIIGAVHIKMPDCIGDEKVLKRSLAKNREIVKRAEAKLQKAAYQLQEGAPKQEGLSLLHHIAGLLGQRLWFYNKTKYYSRKLKISSNQCTGCGKCTKLCPMGNLSLAKQTITSHGKCTMCYRCISNCPHQAITLLGSTVYEQCKIEKYIGIEGNKG